MNKFVTTLKTLRKNGACYEGYARLVRSLQGKPFGQEDSFRGSYIRFRHEEEIPILYILESNGLDDAIWSLRCVSGIDRDARLFAVWCASQVKHLMTDERSLKALEVAERFANGEASSEELESARKAAWYVPWEATWDAAWSVMSEAACGAARLASIEHRWVLACAASVDESRAVDDAALLVQKEMFVRMCNGTAPWQIKE